MDVDFAESASLPHPRFEFAAERQCPAFRHQVLAHQPESRPNGVRVAFDLPIHRYILHQEPAAGLDELGDALEDALWIRKLFTAASQWGPEPNPHVDARVRGEGERGRRRRTRLSTAGSLLEHPVVGIESWRGLG